MEPEKNNETKRRSTPDRVQNYQRSEQAGGVEACMTVLIKVFSSILIFLFFPIAFPMCLRTVQVASPDAYYIIIDSYIILFLSVIIRSNMIKFYL